MTLETKNFNTKKVEQLYLTSVIDKNCLRKKVIVYIDGEYLAGFTYNTLLGKFLTWLRIIK